MIQKLFVKILAKKAMSAQSYRRKFRARAPKPYALILYLGDERIFLIESIDLEKEVV
ncbi:hypothetical protein [Photobacterium carnosum]|uniref:hypothetical protein n=1 Tax=Photobacterium carnosum TaxID=2023717 RepID=UPI001E46C015|nr:hypothetical protein [Photobacterium carnosum]MCD9514758.1 hypothetical protein [Photobacterium carnosum]